MKTAIIGCKSFSDYHVLDMYLENIPITELFTCGNKRIDSMVAKYAEAKNIPITDLWPETPTGNSIFFWRKYYHLIDNCEILVAFWYGKSTTLPCLIKKAKQMNKELVLVRCYHPGGSVLK